MYAHMLLHHVAEIRHHFAMNEMEALALGFPAFEQAFIDYCESKGWHPRIEHVWLGEARGKDTEALFTENLVGISNLAYLAERSNGAQDQFEKAASRWLTHLRIAHARVSPHVDLLLDSLALSGAR